MYNTFIFLIGAGEKKTLKHNNKPYMKMLKYILH